MKLNAIFTSHMVFAADKPIRIYGEGSGLAEISFAEQTVKVSTDADNWIAELDPMPCGGPYTLTVKFPDQTVTLDDIFVGRVYLCAGQSNMQFKLSSSTTPEEMIEDIDALRFFSTARMEEGEPFTPEDGWVTAKKDEVKNWSALGYLVGREIAKEQGVAVGVIGCYQGASMIESWVPQGTYQQAGIAVPDEEKHPDYRNPVYGRWNKDGILYDFALSQVIPFSVSAVVWYQGESNTSEKGAAVYADMLSLMTEVWRKDFADEALPFVAVQIADYDNRNDDHWKAVQQAQLDAERKTEGLTVVRSADISETDDIHPPTKHLLAGRIAAALKNS